MDGTSCHASKQGAIAFQRATKHNNLEWSKIVDSSTSERRIERFETINWKWSHDRGRRLGVSTLAIKAVTHNRADDLSDTKDVKLDTKLTNRALH